MLSLRIVWQQWMRRGRLTLVTVAGVLTLMTGCVVGPDYVRPTVITPAAYKEVDGWKVAQPKDDVIRGAWWEIFGDPQLNALEAQVSISNQNLVVAEATYRQARALVRSGEIGDIRLLHGHYLQDWLSAAGDQNWRVDATLGGASRAFADIGSHWCDLVQFVTGARIARVSHPRQGGSHCTGGSRCRASVFTSPVTRQYSISPSYRSTSAPSAGSSAKSISRIARRPTLSS